MKSRMGFAILLGFLVGYPFELSPQPISTEEKNSSKNTSKKNKEIEVAIRAPWRSFWKKSRNFSFSDDLEPNRRLADLKRETAIKNEIPPFDPATRAGQNRNGK